MYEFSMVGAEKGEEIHSACNGMLLTDVVDAHLASLGTIALQALAVKYGFRAQSVAAHKVFDEVREELLPKLFAAFEEFVEEYVPKDYREDDEDEPLFQT